MVRWTHTTERKKGMSMERRCSTAADMMIMKIAFRRMRERSAGDDDHGRCSSCS